MKYKQIAVLSISTFMLVGSTFAATDQQKRKVLSGWGPWKFGMTLDAAATAAGNNVQRHGLAVSYLVKIENDEYLAGALAMGNTDAITTVVLNPTAAKSISQLPDCINLFERLVGGLTKRYGKPDDLNHNSERKHGAKFIFKDGGQISLDVEAGFDGKGQDDCTASISFDQSPKKKISRETF